MPIKCNSSGCTHNFDLIINGTPLCLDHALELMRHSFDVVIECTAAIARDILSSKFDSDSTNSE